MAGFSPVLQVPVLGKSQQHLFHYEEQNVCYIAAPQLVLEKQEFSQILSLQLRGHLVRSRAVGLLWLESAFVINWKFK